MSNIYLAVIEYIIGWLVYMLWLIVSPDGMNEIKKLIDKDPELAVYPEGIIRAVLFIAVFILCIPWPYYVIRKGFTMISRRLFGQKKGG